MGGGAWEGEGMDIVRNDLCIKTRINSYIYSCIYRRSTKKRNLIII